MDKIQTFFRTLVLSFTKPDYYADIVRAPLSFSFKYYFTYTFLFSLIVAAFITVRWIIPFSGFLYTVPDHIIEAYPEELIVTINNGQVSTNVDEPYFIPASSIQSIIDEFENKVLGTDEEDIQNILVIDTQAKPDDLKSYSTFALVTFDSVSYINDSGNIEIVSLEDIRNITIDKDQVASTMKHVRPFINYVIPIAAIFIVIGLIFYGLIRLLYVLFLAFIVWLTAKATSVPISYRKAYQMGLHFNFIPYSLIMIISLFGINLYVSYIESILQITISVALVFMIKPLLDSTK